MSLLVYGPLSANSGVVCSYIPAQKFTACPPTSTMSPMPWSLTSTRVVCSYVSGGAISDTRSGYRFDGRSSQMRSRGNANAPFSTLS
jgi:hypothetical protein